MNPFLLLLLACAPIAPDNLAPILIPHPGLHHSITEPPCSYASTQNRKGLIQPSDRVIAWIRGAHNGGAIPIRLFLSGPRVVNDTYGLFFYDPDAGFVTAFKKDRGYEFYGWRNGVMVVRGADGTLWSALTGHAFDGSKKGGQLERIPNFATDWNYWLMLHPESTTYDLFDGKRYQSFLLPDAPSEESVKSMRFSDTRLGPDQLILGVEGEPIAVPLPVESERDCFTVEVNREKVAVFWYGPTRSATAFKSRVNGKALTFYGDPISPETAPFKDRETGTRWTLAGRAVDGPLRGSELEWAPSVQCRWHAWAAEYPNSRVFNH